MECKILGKEDLVLMRDVLEDDDMIFDLDKLNDFVENKSVIGFVVKTDDKIVGFAYGCDIIHPNGEHAFFIYSIGVLPEYQNKGYGTELFRFMKDYVKSHGFFEMFVLTDKGNPRACHLYEKFGGKNDYEDEICYVFNLTNKSNE